MCGGLGGSNSTSSAPLLAHNNSNNTSDMNRLTVETEDSFSSLHELAANNDVDGFKRCIERDSSAVDEVGLWYGRQMGSKQMVLEHKTPLMVAAAYGSLDVLKLILSKSEADVNFSCGPDKSTALHCAASGGSVDAPEVVKLLLSAGADPNCVDANGHRPVDVIVVPPKLSGIRASLEEMLVNNTFGGVDRGCDLRIPTTCDSDSPVVLSSSEITSPSSPDSVSSPLALKFNDVPINYASEKKEYPVDPSLPDIKNSIYSTDEFRMYSFKVRPCSRAYSHDWTECPFVHPGENARRRDPRKYHYSCVPCPEFRKGACRRGDLCEYAHGVFECWLHPAQYRTRLCKDGTSCMRRVCFFAHTTEELRPLYVSTGSGVPSPRSSVSAASVMDMAASINLWPGSPASVSMMSPSNGVSHSSLAWSQPNVPQLHLPGSNHQSSRLRSSFNARDILPEELSMMPDFEIQQLLNDLPNFSKPHLNQSGRSNTLTPSNLEELFSAEISSSPRYTDHATSAVFSPSHKSAVLNQFQQQQQNVLSPINAGMFSPKNVQHPLLPASFGVPSPGRMSPRSMEQISSPMGSRLSPFAQQEMQRQQLRSLSARDLGSNSAAATLGSSVNPWSKWGSPNGKVDWSVNGEELCRMRKSSLEQGNGGEEPDLSWVQSLVRESPTEVKDKPPAVAISGGLPTDAIPSSQIETIDHSVLGVRLEQVQLDQLVV